MVERDHPIPSFREPRGIPPVPPCLDRSTPFRGMSLVNYSRPLRCRGRKIAVVSTLSLLRLQPIRTAGTNNTLST